MENKAHHWVDQAAQNVIRTKGDKKKYTIASGITPSGVIHIGNFREMITTELVGRGLKALGKDVRFIFSWDDYDVFRKIPADMPKRDELEKYLWKPIVNVPDPHDQFSSYAEHHEKAVESSLPLVGVHPEFIYQSKEYRSSRYASEILKALEKVEVIKAILNKHRETPLEDGWLPVSIFCEKCLSNKVNIKHLGGERLQYDCEDCKHKDDNVILSKTSIVKLLWRIDWPMRWALEKVDFEPGGKDHSSDGGSFDTGKEIVKQVYGFEAPNYIMYDFIGIKGRGGKVSSSKGGVVTLADMLEIYEPEIVRWIFTSYKPNVEFSVSFDLDVLKLYEDFDRVERIYFDLEEVAESKKMTIKRAYELAQVTENIPKQIPYQPSLRHFCNIIQIYDFDFERVRKFYVEHLKNEVDEKKFKSRFTCAVNWIREYAPEDFRFSILKNRTTTFTPSDTEKTILSEVKTYLEKNSSVAEDELSTFIFDAIKTAGLETKDGFRAFYQCLVGQDKGPKLANLIKTIGYDKVITLIGF